MDLGKSNAGEERSKCNLCKTWLTFALVLALFTRPLTAAFAWNSSSWEWRTRDRVSKISTPEFEETDTRVVIMSGRDAVLPCRISHLSDKVVSWIRTRDLHILTSGPVTFTADERFESRRGGKGDSDWSLTLRRTEATDSGVYECQVNTDPKKSRKITLDVVSDFGRLGESSNDVDLYMVEDEGVPTPHKDAVTRILGEEEQFVKRGSTITFTCLVIIPGETVTSLEWLKNGRQISFQASRGGIIVETEKAEKKTTSRLTVADVTPEDSGNYTCKPSNSKSHSIGLVVVEGERTQAMQRNTSGSTRSGDHARAFLCTLALVLVLSARHQ